MSKLPHMADIRTPRLWFTDIFVVPAVYHNTLRPALIGEMAKLGSYRKFQSIEFYPFY